jgi:hypothetical protein
MKSKITGPKENPAVGAKTNFARTFLNKILTQVFDLFASRFTRGKRLVAEYPRSLRSPRTEKISFPIKKNGGGENKKNDNEIFSVLNLI